MGTKQSQIQSKVIFEISQEEICDIFTYPTAIDMMQNLNWPTNALCSYFILDLKNDPDHALVQTKLFKSQDPRQIELKNENSESNSSSSKRLLDGENQAIGSLLGLVIGDSLGAPLEFKAVSYKFNELKKFGQENIWQDHYVYNRFRVKPGQWTDDSSLALCLADSLLINKGLNPLDLRIRFHNWWYFGYNNAFNDDKTRKEGQSSIGLSSNIGASMKEFLKRKTKYTTIGSTSTAGNGTIIRCSPVPIYHHDDYDKALEVAAMQSQTTHKGEEASECSRIIAHIIFKLINIPITTKLMTKKAVLANLGHEFQTTLHSIRCLVNSKVEKFPDRDWKWKKKEQYKYAPGRENAHPGLVGSYCMDAMAMSLHLVWNAKTFEDVMLRSANLGGDADSVTAVVGQIAGAMFGVSSIPSEWIRLIQNWDGGGRIALTAYKLYKKHQITLNTTTTTTTTKSNTICRTRTTTTIRTSLALCSCTHRRGGGYCSHCC